MSLDIKVVPLGAGQDVGRSCVLVRMGGKNVLFDCGMHMGHNDAKRFPDFSIISRTGKFTELIDCVIISHFHLDHCGALPYFTEMCGYDGPIYMTHPTKAICPLLLEDFRKIAVERKGETNFFTSQMIRNCLSKVITINIHETIKVDAELEIKAYYAGHVLGAAMFRISCGGQSVVYTGDYNMTPDRHLGAAWIDRCRPDLLITETTYATTIRDSKRFREQNFLKKIHSTVEGGGKVLIPVFALGRAQELCILVETYWERMALEVPVYFSAGLTEKANQYYRLFIHWTNQKLKQTFVKRNMFDFKHIRPFDRNFASRPGPMVVFATPGMLHAGTSLDLFKKWAPDPKNMVIIPGYCVVGTVGNKLLAGRQKQQQIEIDKTTTIDVRCAVEYMSFSAHADAKGIMQLIQYCEPKNVMLVHGERGKMAEFKRRVTREFGIPCVDPANGTTVTIAASRDVPVRVSSALVKRQLRAEAVRVAGGQDELNVLLSEVAAAGHSGSEKDGEGDVVMGTKTEPQGTHDDDDGNGDVGFASPQKRTRTATNAPQATMYGPTSGSTLSGYLVMDPTDANSTPQLLDTTEVEERFRLQSHHLSYTLDVALPTCVSLLSDVIRATGVISDALANHLPPGTPMVHQGLDCVRLSSIVIALRVQASHVKAHVTWDHSEETLLKHVVSVIQSIQHVGQERE